jgi:hypothetical protein
VKCKLQRSGPDEAYAVKIEEQKSEGVMEPANEKEKGVEFYTLHQAHGGRNAETTKLCIVCGASAKDHGDHQMSSTTKQHVENALVRSRAQQLKL